MPSTSPEKTPPDSVPVNPTLPPGMIPEIGQRWSPRAFSARPVEPDKLRRLFEAARWSASSFNEQPWRFIIATRDDPEECEKALSCLVDANQSWAKLAPVLILTVTKKTFTQNGKENRVHNHDLGIAAAQFTLQATREGLYVHQMAGVQIDRVREVYSIPDDFEPFTGIAVGYLGDPAQLPEDLRDKEGPAWKRKPLSEIVFADKFGQAASLVSGG